MKETFDSKKDNINLNKAKSLLKRGYDFFDLTLKSQPIYYAAQKGKISIILDIFREAVILNKNNDINNLFLHIKVHNENFEMANIQVIREGFFPQKPFHLEVLFKPDELKKIIYQTPPKSDFTIEFNKSYIFCLIKHKEDELVQLLLNNYEIDPNIKDEVNSSALHYAVYYNSLNLVSTLIEKGANIDKVNNKGRTPLHIAVNKGEMELIKLLLDKGANPNLLNNRGNTPLMISLEFKDLMITKLLLEKGANLNNVSMSYIPNMLKKKAIDLESFKLFLGFNLISNKDILNVPTEYSNWLHLSKILKDLFELQSEFQVVAFLHKEKNIKIFNKLNIEEIIPLIKMFFDNYPACFKSFDEIKLEASEKVLDFNEIKAATLNFFYKALQIQNNIIEKLEAELFTLFYGKEVVTFLPLSKFWKAYYVPGEKGKDNLELNYMKTIFEKNFYAKAGDYLSTFLNTPSNSSFLLLQDVMKYNDEMGKLIRNIINLEIIPYSIKQGCKELLDYKYLPIDLIKDINFIQDQMEEDHVVFFIGEKAQSSELDF